MEGRVSHPVAEAEEAGDALGTLHDDTQGSLHALAVVPPASITALVLRMRAIILDWIKDEVDQKTISGAEGAVTNDVVATFYAAGGDLGDAVPFALLEARKSFLSEADEGRSHALNKLRALACEVLARRIVADVEAPSKNSKTGQHQQEEKHLRDGHHVTLCKRFRQLNADGEVSHATSALESAVDQNCVNFLASREAQRCAAELWTGKLVQHFAPSGEVFFTPHDPSNPSFLGRLDPSRLSVPCYAYYAGLVIHIALIVVYTFCTLEYTGLDAWEVALWTFAAGYLLDDITRWIKMGGLDKVISFWVVIDLCTDILFVTSFSFRVMGWAGHNEKQQQYRLLAFQFLSCIAPLLWMQLLKLADGIQYFGVIQIVLLRMLEETAAFFLLLVITAIGFSQSLFALDAADGHRVENSGSFVANLLVATIMGAPDFDAPGENFGKPFGTILVYVYAFVVLMLLANILVAFFASAYDKTVDDADDVFRAYFCSKVVSSLRAPDQFVYLPPFNLLEGFFIAPFEPILSKKTYATVNRVILSILFFLPLTVIALYESRHEVAFTKRIRMEMLDDLPEERLRNIAQAAGIDNVRDPGLPKSPGEGARGTKNLQSGAKGKAYLSREQFAKGAEKFADMPRRHSTGHDEIDLGAHLYAQGWSWEQGSNPPYTQHLARTFAVAMPISPRADGAVEEELESMNLEVGSPSSMNQDGQQAVHMKALNITQTITYSSTWKVPVIYVEGSQSNGEPVPLDELCGTSLFNSKASQAASEITENDGAAFPMISFGENPANGHAAVYLHPCETAASIARVLASDDKHINRQDANLAYLEAFVMLCSTAVEMRPGSKISARESDESGPEVADGVVIETASDKGDEYVITRETFSTLVGRLPDVRNHKNKNENKDSKKINQRSLPSPSSSVTPDDITRLLSEIKSLRKEVAEMTKRAEL